MEDGVYDILIGDVAFALLISDSKKYNMYIENDELYIKSGNSKSVATI